MITLTNQILNMGTGIIFIRASAIDSLMATDSGTTITLRSGHTHSVVESIEVINRKVIHKGESW